MICDGIICNITKNIKHFFWPILRFFDTCYRAAGFDCSDDLRSPQSNPTSRIPMIFLRSSLLPIFMHLLSTPKAPSCAYSTLSSPSTSRPPSAGIGPITSAPKLFPHPIIFPSAPAPQPPSAEIHSPILAYDSTPQYAQDPHQCFTFASACFQLVLFRLLRFGVVG